MMQEIRLKVGESHWLRQGLLLFKRLKLIYGGMTSPDIYSLVIRGQDGYQAYAYNLYFQKDTPTIQVEGYTLHVKCVSSSEFWCENLGKTDRTDGGGGI